MDKLKLPDIIQAGNNMRIELRRHEKQGYCVVFTAVDDDNRRIIKAPVIEDGRIKVYSNPEAAISDVMQKISPQPHDRSNGRPTPE